MIRLVVEEGPDRGHRLDWGDRNAARIGRDPAADLFLRDTRVSHAHARFERRADGFWVVDLQSRNGTLVNGVPVREKRLQAGDRVRVGDTVLRWVEEAVPGGPPGAAARKSLADRLRGFYRDRDAHAAGPVAPAVPPRAIAFDIEGTLLTTDGLAAEALAQTLREMCGLLHPLDGFPTAGRSETEIARNALRAAGMSIEQIRQERPRILARYVSYLGNALSRRSRGRVLPGVKDLLDRLNADPRWIVGLFTRHIQLSARLLLGHYGLLGSFHYGVYADDAENPDSLPALLLVRAREAAGRPIALDACLVGDSVRLLAVARNAKWKAVAVATGGESYEDLAGQHPTLLARDLAESEAIFHRLNAADEVSAEPAPPLRP